MKRYEYEIGPTGQVSYAAPSGYHDDCVMALALAVLGCYCLLHADSNPQRGETARDTQDGRRWRKGPEKRKRPIKNGVLKAFKMVAGEGHDPPTCGL